MEIPYEVTARRDTGLYNAKVGVWLFLASEVMLFGGLFSGYVFLRLGVNAGVDTPWPLGLNVHGDFVWLGFLNTIILILSSVFVVFAWLALKEGKWNVFRNWMIAVIACAAIFMGVKGYEYNNKLNHHFGIKLNDNSVVEGEVANNTDKISFSAEKVSLSLQGDLPSFIRHISGEFPVFTVVEDGEKMVLKDKKALRKWFYKTRTKVAKDLANARSAYRAAKKAGEAAKLKVVPTRAELTAAAPFKLLAQDRKVTGYDDKKLNYIDNAVIEGKLLNDVIELIPHQIDLQMVPIAKQQDAEVWPFFEKFPKVRPAWEKDRDEALKEIRAHFKGKPIPGKIVQNAFINLHHIEHDDLAGGGGHAEKSDHKKIHAEKKQGEHGAEGHAGHSEHHHPTISVPRSEIRFMGNHGPRYGNYYAIYFTMTALHGLHVIGGALVLLHFVVFGKKLFQKNPEHLANRVEVGGLFWHFVDLVWIFLFPIMYLL